MLFFFCPVIDLFEVSRPWVSAEREWSEAFIPDPPLLSSPPANFGNVSVPFSGATTQFDDALMKHGIITKEQALLAKGMDVESVAEILVKDKLGAMGFFDDPEVDYQSAAFDAVSSSSSSSTSSSSSSSSRSLSDTAKHRRAAAAASEGELDELGEGALADDSFLESYRAKRREELKDRQAKSKFGAQNSVKEISKADWMIEINRASETNWVVSVGVNWLVGWLVD